MKLLISQRLDVVRVVDTDGKATVQETLKIGIRDAHLGSVWVNLSDFRTQIIDIVNCQPNIKTIIILEQSYNTIDIEGINAICPLQHTWPW